MNKDTETWMHIKIWDIYFCSNTFWRQMNTYVGNPKGHSGWVHNNPPCSHHSASPSRWLCSDTVPQSFPFQSWCGCHTRLPPMTPLGHSHRLKWRNDGDCSKRWQEWQENFMFQSKIPFLYSVLNFCTKGENQGMRDSQIQTRGSLTSLFGSW